MKQFIVNEHGGLDVYDMDGELLVRLQEEDVKEIYAIQLKNYDIQNVRDRIPDWVVEQLENDDFFFEDFNSHLYSDDEISEEDIYVHILGDDELIRKIAEDYHELENNGYCQSGGFDWWEALNQAIGKHVSIKGIMGAILCDKHHKELEIGRWKVVVLEKGDTYGLYGQLTYDKAVPSVEFYDMQSAGQFTGATYALDSLLTSDCSGLSLADRAEQGIGLSLYMDVPEWTVQPGELNVISSWLNAVQNRERPTIDMLLTEAKEESQNGAMLPWNEREKDIGI